MTKTIKMSLVAAFAVAGISSVASADVKISGDAFVKYDVQQAADESVDSVTDTDIGINIAAKNADGVQVKARFDVYDGTQHNGAASSGMATQNAYVVAPLPVLGGATLKAGLVPNAPFGAGKVFENGGESWKTDLGFKAGGLKINVGSVNAGEGEYTAGSEATKNYVKVQGKASGFNYGVKYTAVDTDTADSTVLNVYANGAVAGLGVAAEMLSSGGDSDKAGMFVGVSKAMGALSVGVNYVSLSDGQGLGNDFDLDVIDGSAVVSTAADDTTVILVPVSYKVNDKLSASIAIAQVDLHAAGDVQETDIAATYKLGKMTSVTLAHGTVSADAATLDGANQTSLKVATKF